MIEYPWKPYNTLRANLEAHDKVFGDGIENEEDVDREIRLACEYAIDQYLFHQVNDVIHLSVQNSLQHTVNRETLALARDRIPSSAQNDNTLQFLIAFLYEKDLGFEDYIKGIKDSIFIYRNKYRARGGYLPTINFIDKCSKSAIEIVNVLSIARSKIGNFAEDSDFVRNWALINLGKKTGLEVTANNNPFMVGLIQNNWRQYSRLISNNSIKLERLNGLKEAPVHARATGRDDVTIIAKNGPSEVKIKTSNTVWGPAFVLAKDASRVVTKAEMQYDIVSVPILLPIVKRELADITDLNVAVTESVNLTDLFDGIRFNITAVSADTDKVTVSVNSRQSSMGVTGVAVGTSKVTVTATNEAGAISVDFDVNVSAASG